MLAVYKTPQHSNLFACNNNDNDNADNCVNMSFLPVYAMCTTYCVSLVLLDFRPLLCTYVLILLSNRCIINV